MYVYNIYRDEIDVEFDPDHSIKFLQGLVQGFTTSFLFYSAIKYKVQTNVKDKMIEKVNNFHIPFQCDYVDDGTQLMHYKFVPEYIRLSRLEYRNYLLK